MSTDIQLELNSLIQAKAKAKAVKSQKKLILCTSNASIASFERDPHGLKFPDITSLSAHPWYCSTKDFDQVVKGLKIILKSRIESFHLTRKIENFIFGLIKNPKIFSIKNLSDFSKVSSYSFAWAFLKRYHFKIPDDNDLVLDSILIKIENQIRTTNTRLSDRHFKMLFGRLKIHYGTKIYGVVDFLKHATPQTLEVLPTIVSYLKSCSIISEASYDFLSNPFWRQTKALLKFSKFFNIYKKLARVYPEVLEEMDDRTADQLLYNYISNFPEYKTKAQILKYLKLARDPFNLVSLLTHENLKIRKATKKFIYGSEDDDNAATKKLAIRYINKTLEEFPDLGWEDILGKDILSQMGEE